MTRTRQLTSRAGGCGVIAALGISLLFNTGCDADALRQAAAELDSVADWVDPGGQDDSLGEWLDDELEDLFD